MYPSVWKTIGRKWRKEQMKSKKTQKALQRAENYFYSGDYEEAMRMYAILLKDHPGLEEARIGAILTDIAVENDEEAQALFEYYQVLKKENDENAEAIIEGMIGSFDNALEKISDILDGVLSSKETQESLEGITYADFKELVELRGSFKMAFEDIMFSTKVVITEKEDLLDFLQLLVENGFNEMAMRYIEGAAMAYPGESRIQDIIDSISSKK
jgi:tetratricopeptide (TPR) repeat protein